MRLSKVDVAQPQLCAAIGLFLDDAHPVPVHTLAAAAREILSILGRKLQLETFLEELARWRGAPFAEELKKAIYYVSFFEHADRDPGAVLTEFSDQVNDPLLFCCCRDFALITGGLPVHAQVFEAWFFATTVKRLSDGGLRWQEKIRACIALFPGVRSASRADQKRIAREFSPSPFKIPR